MPPTSKRRRRANVTPEEKAALLAVCREIRDEEPKLSVRAYMYRIWARQDVYLLGELCSKAAGEGQDPNEEPIQRLLLEFRRKGLIPYESIIDGTRPTTFAEGGYDHIDQARERMAEARQNVVEYYSLNIWTPQGKRAEMLSEKEALAIVVGRVTRQYGVNLTSSKGFSSESMLYEVRRADRA